jgi:hypothetical protein
MYIADFAAIVLLSTGQEVRFRKMGSSPNV